MNVFSEFLLFLKKVEKHGQYRQMVIQETYRLKMNGKFSECIHFSYIGGAFKILLGFTKITNSC